ncbi:kinase [Micromonospora sp. RTGN7]|uniref:kinase n=1 Tax=Micromonospora sp. RTGN7 TaxID=3016526 RepID=UPI0029FF1FA8|nr:kinase [Micromonospora sp. RTGN7]
MRQGVILYGAPATGKDTITAEMVGRYPRFAHFKRLKCGPGRMSGYRTISPDQADKLRHEPGAILWENTRYGATYFVDCFGLEQLWELGRVPVVHLGQIEAIEAIADGTEANWTVVELYAQPAVLARRIRSRGTGDEDQRFAAVEQTLRLPVADVRIDTGVVSVSEAANAIERCMQDRL